MRLAINLDDLTFVKPDNPAAVVQGASMRRDDILPIELYFLSEGTEYELPDGYTGHAQINLKGTYGGAGLGADSTFAKTGSGRESRYTFDVDLSGASVDTAFSDAGEPARIDALLEIKITDGTHTQRTVPLPIALHNAIAQ